MIFCVFCQIPCNTVKTVIQKRWCIIKIEALAPTPPYVNGWIFRQGIPVRCANSLNTCLCCGPLSMKKLFGLETRVKSLGVFGISVNWIQLCVISLEEMRYRNSWGTSKVLALGIQSHFHLFLLCWKIHGEWINLPCWRPSGNSYSRLNYTLYLIKTFQRPFLWGKGGWRPGKKGLIGKMNKEIRVQKTTKSW